MCIKEWPVKAVKSERERVLLQDGVFGEHTLTVSGRNVRAIFIGATELSVRSPHNSLYI